MIGERTAEEVKMELGGAGTDTGPDEMDIRGRDLLTGLPKTITVQSDEIVGALKDTVDTLIETVKNTLEKTPPELAADIMERGIVLTGGGALLKNLDVVISEETNMPVFIADEPLDCVAIGTGKSLEYIQHFRSQPNVASRSKME